jgi:hypothetical protein
MWSPNEEARTQLVSALPWNEEKKKSEFEALSAERRTKNPSQSELSCKSVLAQKIRPFIYSLSIACNLMCIFGKIENSDL